MMQPSQANYRIAEEYILSNIQGHTFPETNDNEIKRNIKKLMEKFIIHNQNDKAERLSYLIDQFAKRKLKNNGGGYGEIHYSVVRMLLLLQQSPTDLESIEEFKNNKIYRTKEEMQIIEDKKIEELLKIKTEEDKVIQAIQDEWENEFEESSDDQFDSDDEDLKVLNRQRKNKSEANYKDNSKANEQVNATEEQEQLEMDETLINKIKEVNIKRIDKKQIEDSQIFFGGMPLNKIKAPIIKTIPKKTQVKKPWQRPKKFNINAFLDKYLSEFQPPENPYYQKLKQKEREEQEFKLERQEKLRNILGVRTFDQLQEQLSKRIIDNDLIKNSKLHQESQVNQHQSGYTEPLNLLRDFLKQQHDMIGLINYNAVTERQLVMDVVLMLQQLESPTFMKTKKKQDSRCTFQIRNTFQLIHVTPKMMESFLAEFIEMGNIINETQWYLKGLTKQLDKLGMVIESYVYIVERILQRFFSEVSDIQKIVLYQAGQISTSQLTFNSKELSMISNIINPKDPLTLMRLKELLKDNVFKKVKLIHQVMRIGIMDFYIIEEDYNYMDYQENSDSDNDNSHIALMEETEIIQIDKIKPADRVTYLLNSLFIFIKNNQLLQNQAELNVLKEIFITCIEQYIGIMADWVDKGELKDPKQEFFIKANPKVFVNQMEQGENQQKASSQNQWRESFIFRTINLKELMGQGNQGVSPFLQAAETQKVDVSIPIFLRPAMKEILSIGKSIKIIRYLEKNSIVKSGFEEFFDFRQIYLEKMQQQLQIIKQQDDIQFNYFDELKHQPNSKLVECGDKNLNDIWDPSYKIGNIMQESKTIKDYRDLLNVAPFSWSLQDSSSNGIGLFQIPQIQKNLDASFASTKFSDSLATPEKFDHTPERLMLDFEMKSEYDEAKNKDDLSVIKKQLIDEDNYQILSNKYNYSKQELMNYEESLNNYQAFQTFDYLLKNPDNEKEEIINQESAKVYQFRQQTIENFIRTSLTIPIHQIYIKTCTRFVRKLNAQCKLQENLKTLRQIFFMEAGYQMHQFSTQIFKQLDKGKQIDNLYMINGHFNESVCQNLKGADFIEKIRITFSDEPKTHKVLSINALDYLNLSFNSEWPLEIILDKDTITKYNMILLHLMKIKRVNYVLSLKDYWIKPKINMQPYNQMTIKEQIMYKNKILLDKLMHQIQLTQKEFLHFSNNLEYYLKTRAFQQVCNQLDIKLADIQQDLAEQMNQNDLDTNSMIDMDALVQIHQDFLLNIMRLCLLDNKSKLLLDMVLKVLQICLSFRELCQKYFLRSEGQGLNMNNYDQSASNNLDDSDDLGLNLSMDSDRGEEDVMDTINKERDADKFGRGLLRIDNFKFIDRIEECTVELNELRSKFTQCMQILIDALKRYTKKGVFSYLDEAFTRFNFNNYYMSRDREGLD
ncbi:gamma-tubulin complex component 5 [Stylonychia lemnae]|uniref:Gamma-tubulin complex component 5 n=1 Tax=Stylonychia lemnae TaxID=5949 RepID=A0A078ASJ6_STYLE|nr:gamma-tubulin complex component 5 [Stylonychia lemnae]|eukprot:CDW85435.1 gamma-tubulin complex component 5 [Stylonychia lemnae]